MSALTARAPRPREATREPRRLRVLLPDVESGDRAYAKVLESWERALAASERAFEEVAAGRILPGAELAALRRRLGNERRWFVQLGQTGPCEPLPEFQEALPISPLQVFALGSKLQSDRRGEER